MIKVTIAHLYIDRPQCSYFFFSHLLPFAVIVDYYEVLCSLTLGCLLMARLFSLSDRAYRV